MSGGATKSAKRILRRERMRIYNELIRKFYGLSLRERIGIAWKIIVKQKARDGKNYITGS